MAYELINIGAAPNDKTGDPIREGFKKVNKVIMDLNSGTGTFHSISSNYQANSGDVVFVDATAAGVVVSPPVAPVLGTTVEIIKVAGTNDVTFNSVTVASKKKFTYVNQTLGWVER